MYQPVFYNYSPIVLSKALKINIVYILLYIYINTFRIEIVGFFLSLNLKNQPYELYFVSVINL